jgi:hypothetical protein
MALTTYGELLTSIRDWLARDGDTTHLPDSRLADVVRFAEADIYGRLRVREMETSAALVVNGQTVALPADFIGVRRIHLDVDPKRVLEYMAPAAFWPAFPDNITGRPVAYTLEGDNIVFGPAPDATYTGRLLYYARLAALSSAVNSLFTRQPDLWLYGALAHTAMFVQDADRAAEARALFDGAVLRAERNNERDRYGASPLVMRVG